MPAPVRSADELLSIAQAMERKAARRYRELASRMRQRDEERLAGLFEFLATIEDKHVMQVSQRAAENPRGAPTLDCASSEVPEKFDTEDGDSALLTPYRALAIAVRNEARAFAFYSYVAATAPDESARKIAEELAKEELSHADLLRRERRKAYRAERIEARPPPADLPQSVADLWAVCIETEGRAARYHRALAETLQRQGKTATAFIAAAEDEEDCARQAAVHIGRSVPDQAEPIRPTAGGGRRLLEEAFERYSDIASRSREESVMQQAQLLAARAVRRLLLAQLSLQNSSIEASAHP